MPLVVVGRTRVDDAHPPEGDPLLPAQPVDLVGRTEPQRVVGAREHPTREEAGNVVRPRPGRSGDAYLGVSISIIGSSQSRPREPLRTTRTSGRSSNAIATSSAPADRAAASRGTYTVIVAWVESPRDETGEHRRRPGHPALSGDAVRRGGVACG